MLTLAMPQSRARGRQEALGVLQAVGEDRRRQAVRHVVLHRDRLVERLERDQVQDRGEGLGAHDLPVARARRRSRARRSSPGRSRRLAAAEQPAAARDGLRDGRLEPPHGTPRRSAAPSACPARADRRCAPAGRRATRRCSSSSSARLRARARGACVVQRWPAVPTAPNTIAGTARSRLANSSTMMALLPPSSSRLLPRRRATRSATSRPTCVEPVNETRSTRRSSTKRVASSCAGVDEQLEDAAGNRCRSSTRLQMRCTATAHSAVLGDGFHTVTLPQIAARKAFHAHTATGKLKALITPTTPSGCHCSNMRWLGRSECIEQAVEHARLADREVGDVDHLLHLAVALGLDLAHLERDEAAERRLVPAQLLADAGARPRRASARARRARPARDGARGGHHLLVLRGRRGPHATRSPRRSPGSPSRSTRRAGVREPAAVADQVPGLIALEPEALRASDSSRRSRAAALLAGLCRRRPCAPRRPCRRRRRSAGRSGWRARRPAGTPPGARSRGSVPGGAARGRPRRVMPAAVVTWIADQSRPAMTCG